VPIRAKRFELVAAIDRDGRLTAEGTDPIETGPAWSADHLVLAAVARCTLSSLRYHARRAGLALTGEGRAEGVVSRREEDGRYALTEVRCELRVDLDPSPGEADLAELLLKAERDCFVGASLRTAPRYRWEVNGRAVEPLAA
jgi:organic hydroperoxide reductase OsmC/OhrA